jgi:thermitase
MKAILALIIGFGIQSTANAAPASGDYLVKYEPSTAHAYRSRLMSALPGVKVQDLGLNGWTRVQVPPSNLRNFDVNALSKMPGVLYVQPNYKIRLLESPSMSEARAKVAAMIAKNRGDGDGDGDGGGDDCPIPGMCGGDGGGLPGMPGGTPEDNPAIPAPVNPATGDNPLLSSQWGMLDIGADKAWVRHLGRKEVVVAVIDTGVDYTHEDLVENLWRNPGESGTDSQGKDKSSNGVDDDNNGYVDDIIGWDFVSKDNKPFDLSTDPIQLLLGGGNPGHGTHCAGNVAARGLNGKGVSGVAPNISIMSIRFISEKGQGTTADAIASIAYAINNGAHVTSNSWGSEGEDSAEQTENKALRDAIQASQDKGVLFIAAAGNGHQGVGYNNDTDAKPGYPASYDHDIIVSVAALDSTGALGSFSNWGARTVDIGAPGVKVFSTTVGSNYSDTVIDMFGMVVTWDGTSMATPHVAGAAALYLSAHPGATWSEVKKALLESAFKIPSMNGKSVSGGKLNVEKLML